jgi:hypothetical protein
VIAGVVVALLGLALLLDLGGLASRAAERARRRPLGRPVPAFTTPRGGRLLGAACLVAGLLVVLSHVD